MRNRSPIFSEIGGPNYVIFWQDMEQISAPEIVVDFSYAAPF